MRLLLFVAICMACSSSASKPPPTRPPDVMRPTTLSVVEWDVPAGDVTIHARAASTGDPTGAVIVLHGGPGLSHHYTRPLEQLADASRRVVHYDQRAVGRSTAPADENAHGLALHVADLEAVRVALGVDEVDLVGHSWGGLVAMAYTIAYPLHVRRLVLVDSTPPTGAAWDRAGERFQTRVAALQKEGLIPEVIPMVLGKDCTPRLLPLLPAYYHDPRHPATKDLGGSTCHNGILQTTWRAVGDHDLAAALVELDTPVLLIQGESDPFGRMIDDTALAFPGAKQVVIPACGHIPWEECPEPFYAAVREFLR